MLRIICAAHLKLQVLPMNITSHVLCVPFMSVLLQPLFLQSPMRVSVITSFILTIVSRSDLITTNKARFIILFDLLHHSTC